MNYKLYRLRPGYTSGSYVWTEKDLLVIRIYDNRQSKYEFCNCPHLHNWKNNSGMGYLMSLQDWIPYNKKKEHLPEWF